MRKLSSFYLKLFLFSIVLGSWQLSFSQIIESKSISCPGANDGQLNVHMGLLLHTPPLSYAWTYNGAPLTADSIIKGASPGNYVVVITDSDPVLPQVISFNYVLNDPAPIANAFATSPNTTWPANNGSITITTTGGSGWFTYEITDSLARTTVTQTNNVLSGIPSGAYYIKTSDVHGCFRNDKVNVAETAAYPACHTLDTTACYFDTAPSSVTPTILATSIYPIDVYYDGVLFKTLYGYRVGSNIMHSGVATNQAMIYSTPTPAATLVDKIYVVATGPNIGKDSARVITSVSNNFEPGFHTLTLVTANNKGYRYSWDVDSVTAPININYAQINNVCFNGNIGSITATAEGSYEGFTFRITGPTGFTTVNAASASALRAGVYTLTATDWTTSCTRSQAITITQPDEPLRIVFEPAISARCPYSSDGAINIHRVDGAATGAISYLWSNGATTQDNEQIRPDTYSVVVTDANNCTVTDSSTVESASTKSCLYNIVTPNGDGYNDYLDLTEVCYGIQMEAKVFNEAGKLLASLDEVNTKWDPNTDSSTPPTGTTSTYTVFIKLSDNGVPVGEIAESFSVVYSKK